jgi:hypothetical protein
MSNLGQPIKQSLLRKLFKRFYYLYLDIRFSWTKYTPEEAKKLEEELMISEGKAREVR